MACGNRAVCYATKNVNIPSFGYVFVQWTLSQNNVYLLAL
jgi:hypothetical protein